MIGRLLLLLAIAIAASAPSGALGAQAGDPARANAERIRVYHERIATAARTIPAQASLVALIDPVFRLAAERSRSGGAVDENRGALMALAFYVNDWSPALFVPEARAWPVAEQRSLVLRGRRDLARHFALSALIAAAAGTPVAAAAGLYKELNDARGGSGFSFSDLAANRAGELFGSFATGSDASARRLQARVAARLVEDDLVPRMDGLRDNLSEREFADRYGGVGAPAYNSVIDDINRRVAELQLFQ
jgi:hypothetical protein